MMLILKRITYIIATLKSMLLYSAQGCHTTAVMFLAQLKNKAVKF